MKLFDLTGQRFGRLLVLRRADGESRVHWICACDCGKERRVQGRHLRTGASSSCGCLSVKPRAPFRIEGGVAYIPLTRGKTAQVDEVDADLGELNWQAVLYYKNWYARRSWKVRGQNIADHLHRIIARRAGLVIDGLHVDHEDRDTLNCRRLNLRPATPSQNAANRVAQSNSKTGVKGVSWSKSKGKWVAQLRNSGRNLNLGYFNTISEAAAAYACAAREEFGEFARTTEVAP